MSDLRTTLAALDGRGYPAYRDVARQPFELSCGTVTVLHVQPDPFAAPSRLRVVLPASRMRLNAAAIESATARRATADHLHRQLAATLRRSTAHGALRVVAPVAEVLERTAVRVDASGAVIVQLTAALPARGRRILGNVAATLLSETLPHALTTALIEHDPAALAAHGRCVADQAALRAQLDAQGLVAFLADGSVLPRRSGVDERPLPDAVRLYAPESLAVTLTAPHAGSLRGLGIPHGVTVLVGGGYHGKSTLLAALAAGVYDHAPGDGRERCVTRADAVCVRAEDGRSVRGIDLRPFITHLPFGRSTTAFDTDDASGSTSQAAAVIEALEAGTRTLLIDEDTAAANFMVRDARMRRLVASDDEPITPFLDRVRQLFTDRGVSSVLVVGGAGDYLDVADTVIQLKAYVPLDVTAAARAVAAALPLGAGQPCAPGPWPTNRPRVFDPASLDPRGHRGTPRARARDTRAIELGTDQIDVSLLAQLADGSQCHFIGDVLLACAAGLIDGRRSVDEVLNLIDTRVTADGIGVFAHDGHGDRAFARRYEIAAVLNRIRGLRLLSEHGTHM